EEEPDREAQPSVPEGTRELAACLLGAPAEIIAERRAELLADLLAVVLLGEMQHEPEARVLREILDRARDVALGGLVDVFFVEGSRIDRVEELARRGEPELDQPSPVLPSVRRL